MKSSFLFFVVLFIGVASYAQIEYEKGYFIDNNDRKTECLIKNIDWKNNPSEIKYKLSEDAESQKRNIKNTKEFGIYEVSKYIRKKVMIDRKLNIYVKLLDEDKNPDLKEEELFLEVLIEGEASLYAYEKEKLQRFFYSKGDSKIEPLIYKRYLVTSTKVAENNYYKQQIFNNLKCSDFTSNKLKALDYKKKKLIKVFREYNECNNHDFEDFKSKQIRKVFDLNIRPGYNMSFLSIESLGNILDDINFDTQSAYRFGVEVEYFLPFNKDKWAFIIEPSFQSYKSTKRHEDKKANDNLIIAKAKYNSFELPVGIRHYFYLNDKSKLFVNAAFVLDITLGDASIDLQRPNGSTYVLLEMETRPNFAFGVGYKLLDKFSLEMRYQTNREILAGYSDWDSNFSSLSLILGYSLF